MDINTCLATTSSYRAIAYYSHLIPVLITVILTAIILVKSHFSRIASIFSCFTLGFCLWLIGDVIIWTTNNYNFVNFLWAPLDYINIVFYVFGGYFYYLFITAKKVTTWRKIFLVAITLPGWIITITNQSISDFNQATCEAFNNGFLTNYKLAIETVVILFIFFLGLWSWFRGEKLRRKQIGLVTTALTLFFVTFSITEYIASMTGIYEINLYGLFVLPVFLFMIIYAITDMQIFQLRLISTQLLTYVMIILVGSQFFFLENTTNQILTLITFILSLSFGIVLSRDSKREVEQRERLEKLTHELESANGQLEQLNEQKSQFLSFASHDLKSPINIIKQFASLIADGTYKEPAKIQETIQKIKTNADRATSLVDDFLDIRKIEEGHMDYSFEAKDIVAFTRNAVEEYAPVAKAQKDLVLTFETKLTAANVKIDQTRFRQVIQNLLSNSIKYTEKGWIKVSLTEEQKTVLIKVEDSGIGMEKELLPTLFEQFHRAPGVAKKIQGTGLGLFISKQIVLAHGGDVWVESEGKDKGSTFYVRIPKA